MASTEATGWSFLTHVIDDKGDIVASQDVKLLIGDEADAQRPFRLAERRLALEPGWRRIAVGFFHGTEVLKASAGERDWGGRRVILALPLAQ